MTLGFAVVSRSRSRRTLTIKSGSTALLILQHRPSAPASVGRVWSAASVEHEPEDTDGDFVAVSQFSLLGGASVHQAHAVSDRAEEIAMLRARVLVVSLQSTPRQREFTQRVKLPFDPAQ